MSSTIWLSEEEMTLWRAFIAAASGITTTIDASLKRSNDISLDDYEVLVHLSEVDGQRLRMSELSSHILHSRSRITQRIDRLEKRGYVVREKCDEDARGTWAVLTPDGLAALEAAAPSHLADVRASFFDHIDPDDMAPMIRALQKVSTELRG